MIPPSNLHVWAPGLCRDSGGIQAYSHFFARALGEIYPSTRLRILAKHDTRLSGETTASKGIRCHTTGRLPGQFRTAAFSALGIIHASLERPRLICATHPNFTRALHHLKNVSGIPYVSAIHGIEVWNTDSPSMRRGLRGAEQLLSVSRFTRDKVATGSGIDPARISVVADTFDHERFTIGPKPVPLLERYGLQPDQQVILTVSRLSKDERYKGHDVLIDALPLVRKEIPGVHYLIVGKGDDQDRLQSRVEAEGLQGSVTFAGFVPDDEICLHFNLCDAFAMPSTGEGFGIVFLEAMSCGKPVLAGNLDASVEAVDHGNLGALVDPKDAIGIARTLIQLLQKKHPNSLLFEPEALRSKVIAQFGFERFKANLKREFEAILDRS